MTYTGRSDFSARTSSGSSDGRSSILLLLNGLSATLTLPDYGRIARHPPAGRVGPESAWLSWTGRDCNRLWFQTQGDVQGGVGDLAALLTQPITIGHQNHS